MSELAEMFSRMHERYADSEPDSYNAKFIEHDIGDMALREIEAIIKALRFAADMERLKIREIWGPRYTGDVWTVFHLHGGRHLMSEGQDIYIAARRAVEALERGE